MIFRKSKKTVKKSMWTMDKIVTGLVIWGAAASVYGLSRTKKGKKVTSNIFENTGTYAKKGVNIFGKVTVKIISLFQKK